VSTLASTLFGLCILRTGRGATEPDADGSVATSPPPARKASKENTRPSKVAATEGTRSKTAVAGKKKSTKKATRGSESGATEPAQGRGLSRYLEFLRNFILSALTKILRIMHLRSFAKKIFFQVSEHFSLKISTDLLMVKVVCKIEKIF
jgi:hypothetical protein